MLQSITMSLGGILYTIIITIVIYTAAGDDYALFTSPLTFPNGATPGGPLGRQCFNLQPFISNDALVEALESFRIQLSTSDPSAQFTPGRDCATANIADNDRKALLYSSKFIEFTD